MITYPTNKLQKVLLSGGCMQNGTPTPDNPIDIICNNGTIKVRNKSGLPLGYQAVEYLESSGTQYINTGVVPDNDTGFSVTLQCINTPTDNFIYGARQGTNVRFVIGSKETFLYFGYGTLANTVGASQWDNCTPTNKNNVKLNYKNSKIAQVNNSQDRNLTSTLSAFDNATTVTLFGRNAEGTVVGFAQRIYNNEITQGNNVIRNYIPCRRKSDNVLGMFDLVSQTFLTNAGTGTFTAGKDIDDFEIYTDGTQEVVTDSLGNTASAEMLLSVGDYKDTQEVLSGAVARNVGIKVLDGSETWEYYSSITGLFYSEDAIVDNKLNVSIFDITSNQYTATNSVTLDSNYSMRFRQSDYPIVFSHELYLRNKDYTTVADWKQHLADQYANGTPVIIVYPLAEPTTEQVTSQPLAGSSATVTAGSIDNLPIESNTIAEFKKRYIGDNEVCRIFIGSNQIWETDDWYGIRWESGTSNIERIGNMEYHRTLPIQSRMKRCIVGSDGSVRYVSDSDYTLDTDGNPIDYTITESNGVKYDVMVEIPEHWFEAKRIVDNGITYDYLILYPTKKIGLRVPKHYQGAFEAMSKNNNNNPTELYSACKTNIVYQQDNSVDIESLTFTADAATYRGGNRNTTKYDDDSVKTLLGKCATYLTIALFNTIASARTSDYFTYTIMNFAARNALLRLYVVEYASFHSQDTFTDTLTQDGFRQGGLGTGVTNGNGTNWNSLLEYNPIIPCGVTLRLGNNTGNVTCTIPSGLSTIFASTNVPSYRGIENPFGHIWEIENGVSIYGSTNNYLFTDNRGINTTSFIQASSTTTPSGMTLKNSTTPVSNGTGWITNITWDKDGYFIPSSIVKTATTSTTDNLSFLRDYFYGTNSGAKRLAVGGNVSDVVRSGLFFFHCSYGVGSASVYIGSRLLILDK